MLREFIHFHNFLIFQDNKRNWETHFKNVINQETSYRCIYIYIYIIGQIMYQSIFNEIVYLFRIILYNIRKISSDTNDSIFDLL